MSADDFRNELAGLFEAAARAGRGTIVVRSGDLHRAVGGYPTLSAATTQMPFSSRCALWTLARSTTSRASRRSASDKSW